MRLPGKFRLLFLSIVGGVLLAASGWAQDASVPEEASEDAEKEAAESPAQEPDTDDIDVDDVARATLRVLEADVTGRRADIAVLRDRRIRGRRWRG